MFFIHAENTSAAKHLLTALRLLSSPYRLLNSENIRGVEYPIVFFWECYPPEGEMLDLLKGRKTVFACVPCAHTHEQESEKW